MGSIPTAPENITVTFLTPTSVRVSWQTSMDPHTMPVDKYDVTYKPTDARWPASVCPPNSSSVANSTMMNNFDRPYLHYNS
uniref:Fibronectin type-III domain-containing protein n=1 Tax=Anopheles dirus TaxID=7168 RepID=A0A182N7N8_9DIPT